MNVLYRTQAVATGGRTGHAETTDGAFKVDLVTARELGGPGGAGANPEQLFAAGYAACFLSALQFVGGREKVRIPAETTVTTSVGLGPRDDGEGFGLEVALSVHIPGLDLQEAQRLVDAAHVVCPYSHATRGSLQIHPKAA